MFDKNIFNESRLVWLETAPDSTSESDNGSPPNILQGPWSLAALEEFENEDAGENIPENQTSEENIRLIPDNQMSEEVTYGTAREYSTELGSPARRVIDATEGTQLFIDTVSGSLNIRDLDNRDRVNDRLPKSTIVSKVADPINYAGKALVHISYTIDGEQKEGLAYLGNLDTADGPMSSQDLQNEIEGAPDSDNDDPSENTDAEVDPVEESTGDEMPEDVLNQYNWLYNHPNASASSISRYLNDNPPSYGTFERWERISEMENCPEDVKVATIGYFARYGGSRQRAVTRMIENLSDNDRTSVLTSSYSNRDAFKNIARWIRNLFEDGEITLTEENFDAFISGSRYHNMRGQASNPLRINWVSEAPNPTHLSAENYDFLSEINPLNMDKFIREE